MRKIKTEKEPSRFKLASFFNVSHGTVSNWKKNLPDKNGKGKRKVYDAMVEYYKKNLGEEIGS